MRARNWKRLPVPACRPPVFKAAVSQTLAAVALFLASVPAAAPQTTDYNFFDSRTLQTPPAAPAVRERRLSLREFPGAVIVPHPGGDTIQQIYIPGDVLTAPSAADPETIARAFLEHNKEALGVAGTTFFSLPLIQRSRDTASGLTRMVFRQQFAGIPVFGGEVLAHVTRDGSVLRVESRAAWDPPADAGLAPALEAADAVRAAAGILAALPNSPAIRGTQPLEREHGPERKTRLAVEGLRSPVSASLVWFPRANSPALAWELSLDIDGHRWYCAAIDAATGELLFSHNLYRDQQPQGTVFRAPGVPSPDAGPVSIEPLSGWPASAGECPAIIYPAQYRSGSLLARCWVSGAQSAGNNVVACLDASGANRCDWEAYNAQGNFDFPYADSYALTGNAVPDQGAAVVNLFYWANVIHDWLYGLGFDEASGNFQADNFGRGGFGGDPVLADAQDSSVPNRSSFATPPDGSPPRMEIGLFTNNGTFLRRDADFSGDIIAHEYVHGLTSRLVGGAGNTNVLPLFQSGALAEGWSDAYACSFTGNPVFGQYVSATPATGMRSVAYNNSPYTFGQFGALTIRGIGPLNLLIDLPGVHLDGEIWATVLWDLRGALGQSVFESLLTAALKLTPARPSMLDARNAILQAAQAMGVGGSGQCGVWPVFAKRGFGASAALNHVQSGRTADTALSVYQSFDLPSSCGGTAPSSGSSIFFDNMENGANGWTATGLWHLTSRRAASGLTSWWYGQESAGNYATGGRNNGSLTAPLLSLPSGSHVALEWDQLFLTEGFGRCYVFPGAGCSPYLNYDSGWVQVSTDGGSTWTVITTLAHSSDSLNFDHYRLDLSRYAGSTILLRFYFDTLDGQLNNGEGWYIDNVGVRRVLTGTPSLMVAPASLLFSSLAGVPASSSQALQITNADSGTLTWTASAASCGWLAVAPDSGSGQGTLTVTAIASGLPPGTYNGTITIAATGAGNSPAVVGVSLTVAGPAAEWHWDESGAGSGVAFADSSGQGNGATSFGYGSAAFAGVIGNGRAFNGITDRVEAGPSPALSASSFTFRTWLRLLSYPSAAGWGVVASNYGGNYQGWYVAISSTGKVILSVAGLPASAPWLTSNTSLAIGRWYCLTVIFDAASSQGIIYVNGSFDTAAVFSVFTPQSSLPVTFGRASWYDGYYLSFVIDETRLDQVAASPAQVQADYQEFPAPPAPPINAALVAGWHMDDAGVSLTDDSGNGHAATASGTTAVNGVLQSARAFNGVTDFARAPASDAFSGVSFTVRAWIQVLSLPGRFGVVLSDYGGNYQGWYLAVHSSGRVIFSVASLPSSSPWLFSGTVLTPGQWHYVAATWDGPARTATIYIDGAPDAQAILAGFTPSPATDLYFGRSSWFNGYYADATLDEVLILAFAQSSSAIRADYLSFP